MDKTGIKGLGEETRPRPSEGVKALLKLRTEEKNSIAKIAKFSSLLSINLRIIFFPGRQPILKQVDKDFGYKVSFLG